MDDLEINRKIAEACGWKYFKSKDGHFHVTSPSGESFESRRNPNFDPETGLPVESHWTNGIGIPNYVESLDAMHEAEKHLSELQKHIYSEWVFKLCEGYSDYYDGLVFTEASKMIFVTARIKAEAFIRTIPK